MRRLVFGFILFLSSFNVVQAADNCIPKPSNPPRLINDFANIISDNFQGRLEMVLVAFNDSTSTQITIVTVNELCDYEPSDFAFEIGESWGVGNAKFDNGVVILVKPKMVNSRGQAYIATGYGLEGVLPDATAKRIVENEMIPYFKKNDYAAGIHAAAKIIMGITGGEYSAKNYNNSRKRKSKPFPIFAIVFILFFVFIMLISTISRARKYGQKNNMGLWAALWLMGSMNSRHRGRYNDFTSGSGGFGGFGGGASGGFGGFGGGSFGGGGAGGSW